MQGIGQSVYNRYEPTPEELERDAAFRLAGKEPQLGWLDVIRANWPEISIAALLGIAWVFFCSL